MKRTAGLWKARLDTEHFSFEGYGHTKTEARHAIVGAFLRHARQYQIPVTWWSSYRDDIVSSYIAAGGGYRDDELIVTSTWRDYDNVR